MTHYMDQNNSMLPQRAVIIEDDLAHSLTAYASVSTNDVKEAGINKSIVDHAPSLEGCIATVVVSILVLIRGRLISATKWLIRR